MSVSRIYQQLKNVYHWAQAYAWRLWYSWPDQGMKFYGVTGTNGKTTTCILLGNMLRAEYGKDKVGLLTTIVFWFGEEEIVNATKMTTMKSREVFRYLAKMKRKGVTHVVLEMTSHALDQHRLSGIVLEGAIITNIEREHLDYHLTMGAYTKAKLRILRYLRPNAPLVANNKILILKVQLPIIKFSSEEAKSVETPLPGGFNKENVLAAMKLARAVGISEEAIQKGIQDVKHVPGRMEWVEGKGFRVLIDYAVTPDALEKLYQHMKSQTSGKIFAVLGAAGLRDRGKRADMARVVAQYADELVLTREDPWTEPEEQIFQDLEKGLTTPSAGLADNPLLRKEGKKEVVWRRIPDRREALAYFIRKAQAGDVVVITGKGAERGMGIGKKVIPWHERSVIEELVKELNS